MGSTMLTVLLLTTSKQEHHGVEESEPLLRATKTAVPEVAPQKVDTFEDLTR